MSVPDAEMLGCLAGKLNTTTAALLGESVSSEAPDSVDGLAAALAELNDRYICQQDKRRKRQRIGYLLLGICAGIVLLSSAADLLYGWHANAGIAASADVIGGADAATHIYLSRVDLRWIAVIIALAGVIFAVIGLKKTHRA